MSKVPYIETTREHPRSQPAPSGFLSIFGLVLIALVLLLRCDFEPSGPVGPPYPWADDAAMTFYTTLVRSLESPDHQALRNLVTLDLEKTLVAEEADRPSGEALRAALTDWLGSPTTLTFLGPCDVGDGLLSVRVSTPHGRLHLRLEYWGPSDPDSGSAFSWRLADLRSD